MRCFMYIPLDLLTFFYIYAFLGWGVEIAYHAITTGHLVNRGMLAGPVCPIYGFGVVLMVLLLEPYQNQLAFTFIGIALTCTLLELIVGLGLKWIFHAQWWDYSQEKFNIAGLICPKFSLYWGIGGLFLMEVVHPLMKTAVLFIPQVIWIVFCILATIGILIDVIATVSSILHIRRRQEKIFALQNQIFETSERLGQNITNFTLDAQARLQPMEQRFNEMKQELGANKEALFEKAQEIRQDYEDYRMEEADKRAQFIDKYRTDLIEHKAALEKRYKELLALTSRTEKRLMKAFPTFHWEFNKKK